MFLDHHLRVLTNDYFYDKLSISTRHGAEERKAKCLLCWSCFFLIFQLIEKKRRDRINHSLTELRQLVPNVQEKVGLHVFFFYYYLRRWFVCFISSLRVLVCNQERTKPHSISNHVFVRCHGSHQDNFQESINVVYRYTL